MSATVLIVDGGGRGAVLVNKYAESPHVNKILAVPGNDLMQINTKKPVVTYPYLKTTSVKEILEICQKEKVTMVDVAQDNAVEAGLVDALQQTNIPYVIGPTKLAGQIEWDKAWAREFMKKYKIPHPSFHIFNSQKDGIEFVKKLASRRSGQKESKWFIKAYGLAEGKGALPAHNNKEAMDKIKLMSRFGKAGEIYLLEEWLEGEEFSTFVLSDGKHYKIVGSAQDHKRMFNFDEGENTGGVGCSSPPLILTPRLMSEIRKNIISKTIEGLKKEGRPYKGVLYLGGIMVGNQVFVIEFNARWGDPEAEVVIPGIKNDFYELGEAIASGTLNNVKIKRDNLSRVVVTMCLRQSPSGNVRQNGRQIYGIEDVLKIKGVKIYGTRVNKVGQKYYVSSGRLMHIVGQGKNVIEARQKTYQAAATLFIEGNNLHYRTDIGWRDVERLRKKAE